MFLYVIQEKEPYNISYFEDHQLTRHIRNIAVPVALTPDIHSAAMLVLLLAGN
jgi:hypothetical protein